MNGQRSPGRPLAIRATTGSMIKRSRGRDSAAPNDEQTTVTVKDLLDKVAA